MPESEVQPSAAQGLTGKLGDERLSFAGDEVKASVRYVRPITMIPKMDAIQTRVIPAFWLPGA